MTHYLKIKKLLLYSFIFFTNILLAQKVTIPIITENSMLLLQTDSDNRLMNVYFGKPLENENEFEEVSAGLNYDYSNQGIYNSAYTPSGTWNLSEPAIQVKHADENTSLELKYEVIKSKK
jgi:alpha-galactosidase